MTRIFWILVVFLPFAESQSCTSIPNTLHGTWTSTNLGTITISSNRRTLSMTKIFSSQTVTANYFTCEFNSGNQYVFKSNDTVSSFGGNYIIYACFDFRMSSEHVYYYYLNSDPETGLEGLRLKGFATQATSLSQVCETSLHAAEFNTMVKTGSESQAISAEHCPKPLLANSIFTYTDNLGTYCDGDNATISACSDPKYHTIQVNSTDCSGTPVRPIFFSTNGSLGCLLSFTNSDASITYLSMYNKDSSILSTTSQFICAVMTQVTNNTIYMSIFPTDCVSGQTSTTLPTQTVGSTTTYGATLQLVPTGIPPTKSTVRSWTWLIVFLPLVAVLIIFIILIICLHKRCKMREKVKAREKPIIVTDEHPLAEMSIALDAPPTLDRVPNGYIDLEIDDLKTSRSYKRKPGELLNPIGETSLNLSFAGKNWNKMTPRKSIGEFSSDPFTEMDSGIVTLSPEGSKVPRRMKTPRQRTITEARTPRPKTNGTARGEPLAITDGRDPYPVPNTPDPWESKTARSERSIKSFLARSVYAPSFKAPSVMATSVMATSVKAQSVKAPSVKAQSVKASSVRAPSIKAPSVKARSFKASSIRGEDKSLVVRTKPKLTRSFTSTKIGSVTKRAPSSPRKKPLNRSKTMVIHSDADKDGMADFMNAEMTNSGDATGRSVTSKRSARTPRSRAASRATNITSKTARKSILKRKSRFTSSKEFMTEAEIINRIVAGQSTPIVGSSAPSAGSANGSRKLQDEYNDMIKINNPLINFKKVGSSKKPWH